MIKVKLKKCAICKSEFMPNNSMIKHCSPDCAYKLHTQKQDKKHRKEKIAFRIDNRKVSEWLANAQSAVNGYVRMRDYKKPCISCETEKVSSYEGYIGAGGWDSGHYRSRGSAPHLRFNLNNIFRQCVRCNRNLSGNSVEMRKGMIDRIGISKVEEIETSNDYKKFDRIYCERVIKIFNKKARRQRKRLGID